MHRNGSAALCREAGGVGLPFGVLVGSEQSWAQSLQLDCSLKLRGKRHKTRRLCSLLLEAVSLPPASPQPVSEVRDGMGCPAPSQRRRSACR